MSPAPLLRRAVVIRDPLVKENDLGIRILNQLFSNWEPQAPQGSLKLFPNDVKIVTR
jgi:hypothetical protein